MCVSLSVCVSLFLCSLYISCCTSYGGGGGQQLRGYRATGLDRFPGHLATGIHSSRAARLLGHPDSNSALKYNWDIFLRETSVLCVGGA